jgi:hypothetical protein
MSQVRLADRRVITWRDIRMESTTQRRSSGRSVSRARVVATRAAAFLGAAVLVMSSTPSVLAGGPDHFGPFENSSTSVGSTCDGFDVLIESSGTDEFTVWTDANGDVVKILYRARYPHDVLTNMTTNESIVVRGEFQETLERIAGTDVFGKTITGFRYMVNKPGTGVIVRDVGRIVYGDLAQTILLWEAGKHELVFDSDIDKVFCAALA